MEAADGRALARSARTLRRLADLRRRLYRWRRDGTWDRLLAHVQTKSDAVGEVIWEISVDSSTARAHQHASGARRRPSRADEKRGFNAPKTKGYGAAAAD